MGPDECGFPTQKLKVDHFEGFTHVIVFMIITEVEVLTRGF